MHIKNGFELRDVCGEKVVLATGIENVDFTHIISLNESAAYLWQNVADKEFDTEMLVQLICKEYEVNSDTAKHDAENIVNQWLECGIIE